MTPNNARLTLGGAALLAAMGTWEGASQFTVYADKLAYGIATVCKGHTGRDMNGNVLVVGTPYTKAECDRIDRYNAVKYSLGVLYCVNVDITQNTLNALTLFAINVGIKGACGSRAVALINQSRYVAGCNAIAVGPDGRPVWSNAGGRYVQGLQNRRQFEKNWCLKGLAI
jgi:lysozyme